jgi:hypothetical protein
VIQMKTSSGGVPGESSGTFPWPPVVDVLLVMILAFAVRWIGIGQEPLNDELYNFLAARAWVERGDLSILPGADPYSRGSLFTYLIAVTMSWLGTTLEVARIPSVVAGTALAGIVTGWLGRSGLRLPGMVAGALIALDPELIQLSQITRFYSFHQVAVLLGAIALVVALVSAGTRARLAWGGVATACILLAAHLQITTVVALGGLFLFSVLWPESFVHGLLRRQWERSPRWSIIGGVVLVVGGLAVAWMIGAVGMVLDLGTRVDLWAEGNRDNVRFYYAWLHDQYAPLVVLFPLLALLSWTRAPRLTALSIAVFAVAFTAHSLVAWKATRYLTYALPFFFIVSSIGVVEGLRRVWAGLPGLFERVGVPLRASTWLLPLFFGVIVASLVLGSRANLVTARLLVREPELHFPLMGPRDGFLSWTRATPTLDSLSAERDLLVVSNAGKAVHFLGDFDYIANLDVLVGADGRREEFWVDRRFDRPVIAAPESMAELRCMGSLVVVVEGIIMGTAQFPAGLRSYLDREGEVLSLPNTGLAVYSLDQHCEPEGPP